MPIIPVHKSKIRIRTKVLYASFQGLGKESVIGIKEGNVMTGTATETGISRSRQTLVGLPYIPNGRKAPSNQWSVISRTIIHHNHLNLFPRLVESAINRIREKLRLVVTGNHNGNKHSRNGLAVRQTEIRAFGRFFSAVRHLWQSGAMVA